jgi:hypothetical protein
MKLFKMIISILAALVAVVFAIKFRKTIKNSATNVVEKGKSKVMQGKAWLKEAK